MKTLKNNLFFLCTLCASMIFSHAASASCVYTTTNDWGTGFDAQIVITNDTTTAVTSWSATWEYTGTAAINSAWNGVLSGSNPYTVQNTSWNGTIQPGQSVTVGLGGSGIAETPNTITGNLCSGGGSSSSSSSSSGSTSSGGLPTGISAQDIGNTVIAGSSSYANDVYTITAAGADIEGTADAFHYTYGTLTGDGELIAKIETVTEADTWTKVGLMLRTDLDANSQNAFMLLRPTQGSAFQHRNSKSSTTESTWQDTPYRNDNWVNPTPYRARYVTPSTWLRLIKNGDTVEAYSSDDGMCWNIRWRETISFPTGSIYAGVALTSHTTSQTSTATVSGLEINATVPTDVNASCARAQADNEVAPPTQWIVQPGIIGNETWNYTLVDPVATDMPVPCQVGSDRMRYTNDDPACPIDTNTHAWTNSGYGYTSNWVLNANGGFGVDTTVDGVNTQVNASDIWLRKEFTLTADQINSVMFWGKWTKATSIYINGVLATVTTDSPNAYHYLGLNANARAALVAGTNVLAVRVKCESCNVAADFGIGINSAFANYPRNIITSGSQWANLMDVYYQFTLEQAALGGAIAVQKDGLTVENQSFGYSDIGLTTAMPANAIMRLASVDKLITNAAIVKLINDDPSITKDSLVFGPTGILSHITAVPGWQKGNNVENITLEHLRTHSSGITGVGSDGQGWKDEVAFRFGIKPDQLTSEHLASVFYSFDTTSTPGTVASYNSNGYFLLRYVVEHVTGQSLNTYLATSMGATDIVVAAERLADRQTNEPDYQIIDRETRARWFELENYLALSASAPGLVSFFDNYAPRYEYHEDPNNPGVFKYFPYDGGIGGAMNGTRSGLGANPTTNYALGHIWNSDFPGSNRKDDLEAALNGVPVGNCKPTTDLTSSYRIRSAWTNEKDTYLNTETISGQAAGLKATSKDDQSEILGWHSAQWNFIQVIDNGQTYYIIQNRYQPGTALHLEDLVLNPTTGKLEASAYQTGWHSAQWILEDYGNYFKLRNRYFADRYIHIENGTPEATAINSGSHSARWYLCY
ncbi:cellulose binding domain-containing protein [Teredinibacter sp. KSP-S5-2]|uniref:cellulose binding domain-containing protein n=1 Tax=Teredinibacter sp. KSP-S5-2 TaxID=3034506 RepID=UPI0029351717|nr:cellulose binding domain-containing protein [Teredinibacter sp. KSP-S5-2]WNO10652.1 cellulose binding domain-containing protein [Teredinibacter sp. KSP-S5-2]